MNALAKVLEKEIMLVRVRVHNEIFYNKMACSVALLITHKLITSREFVGYS